MEDQQHSVGGDGSGARAARGPTAQTLIIAAGLLVFLLAVLIRRYQLKRIGGPLIESMHRAFRFSYGDAWLIIPATIVALIACSLLRRRAVGIALSFRIFMQIVALSLAINVIALRFLGTPVTIHLIQYADLFRSFTAQEALRSVVSWKNGVWIVGAMLAAWFLTKPLAMLLQVIERHRASRLTLYGFLLSFTAYFAVIPAPTGTMGTITHLQNPLVVFFRSMVVRPRVDLLAMNAQATPVRTAPAPLNWRQDIARRPHNMLLFVLESVGAEMLLSPDPAIAALTPNLQHLRGRGVTFSSVYTPVSTSTRAGYALISSRYPGFRDIRDVMHDGPADGLGHRMDAARFRTAMFMTGDLRYQGFDDYVAAHGFGLHRDMTARGCNTTLAIDDSCTVTIVNDWLSQPSPQPFGALIWTGQTHFPYYSHALGKTGGDDRARYAASLHETDAAIGRILAQLQTLGKLDDTLVVVIGDHGEAFGQHGFRTHGNTIFEEEVHVPLIMAHASLPPGVTVGRVGSTVDVTPTILGLLGLGTAPLGQGHDLLGAAPSQRAFFGVMGNYMNAAYREGSAKYALDLMSGEMHRYDLVADPGERRPQPMSPQQQKVVLGNLSAWSQYGRAANHR